VEKVGEMISSVTAALRRAAKACQAGLRTVFCTADAGRASRESLVLIGILWGKRYPIYILHTQAETPEQASNTRKRFRLFHFLYD
jgi:hypothetical protein